MSMKYKCQFGVNNEEVFEEHTLVTKPRSFMSAKCQVFKKVF